MPNPILDFYGFPERKLQTEQYRLDFCFNDIFSWSDDVLEEKHDYIQWFFPTTQKSVYHPDAPTLNVDELCFFSTIGITRKLQRKAFERMMKFYGIDLSFFGERMFWDKDLQWLTPRNHNFLRITRILTSLKLFRNDRQAKKLLDALLRNRKAVREVQDVNWMNRNCGSYAETTQLFPLDTVDYWINAVNNTDPDVELNKLVGLL